MVRFSMFNIRNGCNGGLESALCGLNQGRVDCGVIQDKNLTNRFYTLEASGFRVMTTEAPSGHRGGVVIFYHKAERFSNKRDPSPRPEFHHIPDGDGTTVVACRGVLYCPQRCLDHTERHCGHQGLTLWVRDPCGRQPQCQRCGSIRHTVRRYHCIQDLGGGANERGTTLPPMA